MNTDLLTVDELAMLGRCEAYRTEGHTVREDIDFEENASNDVATLIATVAGLREALNKIAQPNQDELRAACATNDIPKMLEAVTKLFNHVRDIADAALAKAKEA